MDPGIEGAAARLQRHSVGEIPKPSESEMETESAVHIQGGGPGHCHTYPIPPTTNHEGDLHLLEMWEPNAVAGLPEVLMTADEKETPMGQEGVADGPIVQARAETGARSPAIENL